MTELIFLPGGKGATRSRLEGDTLRVRPEIFASMQDILNKQEGEATELVVWALRRAGLTDEEIVGRTFQNTKLVVDHELPVTL